MIIYFKWKIIVVNLHDWMNVYVILKVNHWKCETNNINIKNLKIYPQNPQKSVKPS